VGRSTCIYVTVTPYSTIKNCALNAEKSKKLKKDRI